MIFVTGDTHSDVDHLCSDAVYRVAKSYRKEGEENYIIVAGDFGFVWDVEESDGEREIYRVLKALPFEKVLFLDGNHENFDRLDALPKTTWCGGEVGVVRDHIYHLRRGQVYKIQDKTIWTFGGGKSHDREWREQEGQKKLLHLVKNNPKDAKKFRHYLWWPQEIPSEEEMQFGWEVLERCNFTVDYIITHEAPKSIVAKVTEPWGSPLEDFLEKVYSRARFKKWLCGHYHRNVEVDDFVFLYHNLFVI